MTQPDQLAQPPHRLLLLSEVRAMFEWAAFPALRPWLTTLPPGDGQAVVVFPGFLASDASTAPLRGLLRDLGYDAHGWGMGQNVRVDVPRIRTMLELVQELFRASGAPVSLVGWSLGGVFAREIAKIAPDAVRQVITLGSPISDERNHTNVRGLFELFNGEAVAGDLDGHRFTGLNRPPPVPTTSIYSRSDGVVHWHGSIQHAVPDHGQTENIAVCASHTGLGVNPAAIVALADRLAQPAGAWRPFVPSPALAWAFSRP